MSENMENVVSLLNEIKARLDRPQVQQIVVDIEDIAVMFGKSKQSAFRIVKALDFPTPLYSEGHIKRCWLREEVEKWARSQKLLQNRKYVV